MEKTCLYKINGFCYMISRIDERLGLVYLKTGNYEIPVRLEDVEDIRDVEEDLSF